MPSSQHALDVAPPFPLATLPIHSDDAQDKQETLARFICAVCPEVGEESWPDADEYTDVMGRKLRDARITPNGQWVCSQPCLSQLMFQSATPREQEALKSYALALEAMTSAAPEVEGLLRTWECFNKIPLFPIEIAQFAIGAMERRQPKKRERAAWIENNIAPEETLRDAIGKAVHDLEWRAQNELRSDIDFLHRIIASTHKDSSLPKLHTASITTEAIATALGTIGRVITTLKAAVAGEVAE